MTRKDRRETEIQEHLNWLDGYAACMTERNWRDMKLYIERQVAELRRCLKTTQETGSE